MFDVSFGELLVVGAVALVVLGPERLPKVARTAGVLLGRAQRFVASVKSDLNQQIAQTELASLEAELRAEAEQLRQQVQSPLQTALDHLPPLQTPESLGITPLAASMPPERPERLDDPVPPAADTPPGVPADEPARAAKPRRPRVRKIADSEVPAPAASGPDAQLDLFADHATGVSTESPSQPRDRR